MIITAITLEKIFDFAKKKDPKKVEDAQSKIKIKEKPRTNRADFCKIKYLDFFCKFSRSVPQINER